MRVLLSGIIGAAAAAAAWLAIEHFAQSNFGWLACLVGLVTGFSVRSASTAGSRGGSLRGALAILLTLAAIVGGRLAYVKVIQSMMPPAAQIAKAEIPVVDDSETNEDETDSQEPEQPEVQEALPATAFVDQAGIKKPSIKSSFSEWDMLWMSLSALAAYIIGNNSGSLPAREQVVDGEPSDEDDRSSEQ